MKVYKLTDQEFFTRNNTLWGENVTHETSGEGKLCSEGWLHYYHHPLLAILLNPIHADISNPILWEAEAEGKQLNDRGLKGGCTKLTTIKQITLPEITLEQRVEFAIRCAMEVYKNENWLTWAKKWISGEDRSQKSAHDAYADAHDIAADAADATHVANGAVATYVAAVAAVNATYAAYYASVNAPYAAVNVADTTSYAASAHATEINFDAILKEVFG